MWQSLRRIKYSVKVLVVGAIILIGVTILLFLGYTFHRRLQSVEMLQRRIQISPSSVLPDKKIELEINRLTLENAVSSTLIQGIGGVLLFLTAYVSLQNLEATRKNVVVAEEKQVTDRFTQAIDQLGDDKKITVRLGGIYSLERISKDSTKDYLTIMKILASFVRSSSSEVDTFLKNEDEEEEIEYPAIRTDVQAAITVIGYPNKEFDNLCIDLSATYLYRVNLSESRLIKADLSRSVLIGANLSGAKLSSANLTGADLHSANLCKTDLSKANLLCVSLKHADLSGANLTDANLNADLSCAYLMNANLTGAELIGANLNGANLSGANLTGADLNGADLINANFSGANLNGANLSNAKLATANLREAQNLTYTQLESAKLCRTILPTNIQLNPNRDCKEAFHIEA